MRTMKTLMTLLLLGLGLACMPNPKTTAPPFDETALAPYAATGTATITGQAFLKTRAGDVKYGAGNKVALIPDTPYTRARQDAIRRGQKLGQPDSRLDKYTRYTQADGFGNFEFHNVPAGRYFVTCIITWEVGRYSKTGGVARAEITIEEGGSAKVVVTL